MVNMNDNILSTGASLDFLHVLLKGICLVVLFSIAMTPGAGLVALAMLSPRIWLWAKDTRWFYIPRTEDDILFEEFKQVRARIVADQAKNR